MLKQRIISSLWWLLAVAVAGLLVAAVQQKKNAVCTDIKVDIEGNQNHVFVDEKAIVDKMLTNGVKINKKTSVINLRLLETILKKDPWIQSAELYFYNNGALQINIKEREPIARIFTTSGFSFYIDSAGKRLPLSADYTAHVPVFTSFTSDKKHLSKRDSLLLTDVKNMALFIQQDSFWNAQLSQVVITPQSTFSMIPVVGNQTIILGDADSLESKFARLSAFYKQVWAKAGFEKYETINVSFANQVVATRRGEPKPYVDSVLAQRIVSAMRSGVDILKDSSFSFRNINKRQEESFDTSNNQLKNSLPSIKEANALAVRTKPKATLKVSSKTIHRLAKYNSKAAMPKRMRSN